MGWRLLGGNTEVVRPEVLGGREGGGRGSTPFELDRDEEVVDVDKTLPNIEDMLPGPDASLCLTSEARLLVSLLEAGEPRFRWAK